MLAEVLDRLDAGRMVVGHTVQKEGISSECEGRIWQIDVGLAAHYGGELALLEIRDGEVQVVANTEFREH